MAKNLNIHVKRSTGMDYVQIILGYWVDDFYFCPIDKVIYNRINLLKIRKSYY